MRRRASLQQPPFAVAFRGHCRSDLRNPSEKIAADVENRSEKSA
jgi:hypothetical protein